VLSEAELQAWGWRIPFAIGALLALAVYLLRRRLAETASFAAMAKDRPRSSLGNLWRAHPREFLLVAAITAGGSLCFYAYTTYMQKFLVNTSGFNRETATQIMTAALIVYMLAQPVFGHLSDRLGRKPMLIGFGVVGSLATVPVYSLIAKTTDPVTAFALIAAMLLVLSAYTSIGALIKAELFPAHIRTLGVALPYALGNALFGGSAEYVALWFKQAGIESAFYWYVSAMIAVALVAFLLLPETKRTSLIAED
jgi:MHS family alpha-ketoglutarate permease-like MFS transporter